MLIVVFKIFTKLKEIYVYIFFRSKQKYNSPSNFQQTLVSNFQGLKSVVKQITASKQSVTAKLST